MKGSKPRQWAVVHRRPGLRVAWVLLFIGVWLGSTLGAYFLGQFRVIHGFDEAQHKLLEAREALARLNDGEAQWRQQTENARLGAEVDRQALEGVRREMLEVKAKVASLEEENQFYRNLMAPDGGRRGLQFGAVEIVQTDRPRSFRYRVVMQQLATKHEWLNAVLTFNVVGRRFDEVTVLPLSVLSSTVAEADIRLRFKYFQTLEGELTLPEGFEPERIELEAKTSGRNATSIEKHLAWLVQRNPSTP